MRRVTRRLKALTVAAVVCVGVLCCAGCGVIQSAEQTDDSVTDLVWLGDGWQYFLHRDSSDSSWEVWRRRPGRSHAEVFAQPGASCPAVELFLFAGPAGGLGVGQNCPATPRQSVLVEYSADGSTTTRLASLPYVRDATWRAGDSRAYVEQVDQSCWGISPVRAGALDAFAGPISWNGKSWRLEPWISDYSCDRAELAGSPTVTRDGSALYFLVSTDDRDRLQSTTTMWLNWQLFRWTRDAPWPEAMGGPFTGAGPLRLSPDDRLLAVAVRDPAAPRVVVFDLRDGTTREVGAGIQVQAMDFSPDGTRLAVQPIVGLDIRTLDIG